MYGRAFPFYSRPRTPFVFDVRSIEIIVIFVVTACTLIIILPGIRGKSRPFWLLRVLTSLSIGAVILAVNFTSDWEVGSVTATTVYKSFSSAMVNASIGLWVGLNGVNITLTGNPVYQLNETINYNEEFAWESGKQFDEVYREGLEKGLPNPILYVAEKFIIDSPCGLHRQYRISTYYSSAILWVAFSTWIISNVLFSMPVLLYGIYMMLVTAICIIFSLVSFASIRQTPICSIQFGSSSLHTRFGLSFWLSLVTGMLCLIISLGLVLLHRTKPKTLRRFFNHVETDDFSEKTDSDKGQVYILDDTHRMTLQEML
ncbi:dual oxidase maturation factor 1-like isoform X2 [Ascaphus truei]|uniref:dual oxidase maturation factor 1-like isoform X2 n=1 Tax=Ascaphus truei TaxID=8439 RepID=UPI003F5AACE9